MISKSKTLILGIFFMSLSVVINFLTFEYIYAAAILYYTLLPLPVIELYIIIRYTELKSKIVASLLSVKWILFLITIMIVWAFALLIDLQGMSSVEYIFESFYYPGFTEQVIFSMLGVETLSLYLRRGTAMIVTLLFYWSYYMVILPNSLPGFPGLYLPYFALDVFGVMAIYVASYASSKSIYLAISIEISLLMVSFFIPPIPAAFFYTFVPS
jgi:hypothetical protein